MSFSEVVAGVLVMGLVFFGILFGLQELSSSTNPTASPIGSSEPKILATGLACEYIENVSLNGGHDGTAYFRSVRFKGKEKGMYIMSEYVGDPIEAGTTGWYQMTTHGNLITSGKKVNANCEPSLTPPHELLRLR